MKPLFVELHKVNSRKSKKHILQDNGQQQLLGIYFFHSTAQFKLDKEFVCLLPSLPFFFNFLKATAKFYIQAPSFMQAVVMGTDME